MPTITTKETLETTIGVKPNLGYKSQQELLRQIGGNSTLVSALRQWVSKNGIPFAAAAKAKSESLVCAYTTEPYLKGWRNRVNPSYDKLSSSFFDDEKQEKEQEQEQNSRETQNASASTLALDEIERKFKILAEDLSVIETAQTLITGEIARQIENGLANRKLELSETAKAQIRQMTRDAAEEFAKPKRIEILHIETEKTVDLGLQHFCFETLLKACRAQDHKGFRLNIWLTGPTGSGKTTAAENVAKALDLSFEVESSLDADYKVLGYKTPSGDYVETAFFRRFTQGGVMLMDEIDNFGPSALLALNAATANSYCQFPHGMFKRHKDCVIIAAANTWGLGATNEYVGRSKLDAASLDRFQPKIDWPVDEKLERAIAESRYGSDGAAWHDVILSARQRAKSQGLKIIISPRATFSGISLLIAGFSHQEVIDMTFAAGLSPDQRRAIGL